MKANSQHESAAKQTSPASPQAIISWPGYGIMFFWQLGIMQYLQSNFDLSKCTMVGSSAGALLSVLSACGVSAQSALDKAHQLCIQHGVFSRLLGLAGVWGGIVRCWLQELLPPDAAELCSGGHVQVVITTLPLLQRKVISSFKDRDDLIEVALASAHVPYLLDWQLSAACRGSRCVDGSLLYMITRRCPALKPQGGATPLLLFDPVSDRQLFLNSWQLLRCVLLCGKEGAQQLLQQGFDYAARLDESGGLKALAGMRRASRQQQQHPESLACITDAAGTFQQEEKQGQQQQQQQQQQQLLEPAETTSPPAMEAGEDCLEAADVDALVLAEVIAMHMLQGTSNSNSSSTSSSSSFCKQNTSRGSAVVSVTACCSSDVPPVVLTGN